MSEYFDSSREMTFCLSFAIGVFSLSLSFTADNDDDDDDAVVELVSSAMLYKIVQIA